MDDWGRGLGVDGAERDEAAKISRLIRANAVHPPDSGGQVEQAVSYVRAEQSGLWHVASDGSELERVAPHREPCYDEPAIRAQVEIFTEFDRSWAAWFAQERIQPLRLTYARLADDPVAVTRDVLASLELDPDSADDVEPGVRKMAGATTEDWVNRFRSEVIEG